MPKETFLKLPEEKKNKIIKAAKKEFERVPFEQTSIKITNTEVNITDITYTLEEAKNIGIEKAKQELNNKIENLDNILSIQINDSQTSEYIEVEVTYEMLENIGTKEKIVF